VVLAQISLQCMGSAPNSCFSLQRIRQERKVLCCVEQRRIKFLGHVIRKGNLEDLALSGRIPGKRVRVTQRFTFINILKVCVKILGNYGRPQVIEHKGKTSWYIEGWISHDSERVFCDSIAMKTILNVSVTRVILSLGWPKYLSKPERTQFGWQKFHFHSGDKLSVSCLSIKFIWFSEKHC